MNVTPEALLGSHLWGVMEPRMGRPQPLLLLSPLLAQQLAKSAWGGQGEGTREKNRMGGVGGASRSSPHHPTPSPPLPGCGTNQFSLNFFLAQSEAGSDKECRSRRSGAKLNAAQTHPTPPEPESQPEPNYPLPSRSVALRGQPDAPKA